MAERQRGRQPAAAPRSKAPRNAERTRARILAAARTEFASKGLGGARVDAIAERANANKRMIYHYFGSKEDLFRKVVETAYADIRSYEQKLDIEHLPARDALEQLVRFTWDYYLKNPEFICLVNSANLHKARHLKGSKIIEETSRRLVGMVGDLLDRGVAEGAFRSGIDPVQLNITIAAIGYYYLTNRFTGTIVYQRDLMEAKALDERLAFNLDTILRLVCVDA